MQDGAAFIVDDDKLSFETSVSTLVEARQPAQSGRLLRRIRQELETCGALIACVTSVINHAYRFPHRSQRLMAGLPLWLPPELASHGSEGAGVFLDRDVLAIVNGQQDLKVRIAIARELTLRHCANVETAGPRDPVAIDQLAGLWGIICERALGLIQDVGGALPYEAGQTGSNAPGAIATERLLAAAALGASPCVTSDGAIEIPGWIERRAERRHRLRLDCELSIPGRAWQLRTIDISRQGAGLVGSPPLQPGMRARLVIGRWPKIDGVIVWRTAERLGFRFDAPLSIADLGCTLAGP
jgi:hypothetical protein